MTIANARMYSVSPEVDLLWHRLLTAIIESGGGEMTIIEHTAPAPIEELWRRRDQGAVFMCGLPYARAEPAPFLVAAPIPAPVEFKGEPEYWSEFVVRADSDHRVIGDTFGKRLALTVPGSQSGCAAALHFFMALGCERTPPLYADVIAPTITPLGALTAVIDNAADVAPIDSYAWALLCRYRPDLTARVRSIARTVSTPIPALVASSPPSEALQAAFLDAHRQQATRELMSQLLLQSFTVPVAATYAPLRERFDALTRRGGAQWLAAAVHPAFAALRADPR